MGEEQAPFFYKEGQQGPMRQLLDFREAKQAHRQQYKAGDLIPSIQHTKQDKIIDNNLKVPRSRTTLSTLELDGNIIFQQVRLHPRNGSSTMIGSRIKVGIIGDLQPGLNSNIFWSKSQTQEELLQEVIPTAFCIVHVVVFCLPATFNSLATAGVCEQYHLSHSMYRCAHSVHTSHCTHSLHSHLRLNVSLIVCPK